MMILKSEVLSVALILLQVYFMLAIEVPGHLPTDWKTGLLRFIPDLSEMTDDEIVEYRDIILKNPGHEAYCKPSGLPNNILWWHWRLPNWCRVPSNYTIWRVYDYDDLCCGGHGYCYCHYRNSHCNCEVLP